MFGVVILLSIALFRYILQGHHRVGLRLALRSSGRAVISILLLALIDQLLSWLQLCPNAIYVHS